MYIISLSDVSEQDMDFKATMYFRQIWIDHRLAFDPDKYGMEEVVAHQDVADKLWTPDTFFANIKKIKFHQNILTGKDSMFVRVKHNGEVYTSKM